MPSESFLDQIKAFGARLGLPKVDVDKLIEMNRKNFEALMQSAVPIRLTQTPTRASVGRHGSDGHPRA
jgi:hypothetical protein